MSRLVSLRFACILTAGVATAKTVLAGASRRALNSVNQDLPIRAGKRSVAIG
jgi:hypothetical protein